MIVSANEMRTKTISNGDFEIAIQTVMKAIVREKDKGNRYVLFDPRPTEQFEDVKREFEKHGYIFRPVGYIGGVWQRDIYICW